MNKIIISIFILLWVAVGAMAQTATVTGTVTDDMGPVIGATVTVQGTSIGATTHLDGKFTLTSVPNVAKAVLIVRYVGMEEAKEPLKGRTSNINIHNMADIKKEERSCRNVGRCSRNRLWYAEKR